MKKELRDTIISGIGSAILVTIILYLIKGRIAWAYLLTYPIFFAAFQLYFFRRREEKKDQRRE